MKTTMKRIFSLLIVLVMVCGMLPTMASAAEVEKTMSFASTAQRISQTASAQEWRNDGIVFINNKAASTSNVVSNVNPVRLYASSSITIQCAGMKKIVFNCNTNGYATALKDSITNSDVTVSVSSKVVTVTFGTAADELVIAKLSAQVRLDSMVVTVEEGGNACDHNYVETITTAATCTTDGVKTFTCSACGDSYTQAIPATGHTWDGATCSTCGVTVNLYVLVDDVNDLAAGDEIIIVSADKAYALGTTQNSNNRNAVSISATAEGYIALEDGVQAITLKAGATSGTFALNVGNGYLRAVSGNNYLRTQDAIDANSSWTITIANGEATIIIGNYQIMKNSSSALFSCYKGTQKAVAIYKLPASAGACTHEYTEEITTAATCTTAGEKTLTCSLCGDTKTEVIPATGHDFSLGDCACGATDPSEPEPEEVKIVFELGENGDASHVDGTSATEYTETVGDYTLNITGGTKMYTGAVDATGNGCIKLGTSSVVGGFSFEVPTDVEKVVIRIAKYKAKTTKVNVNGTEHTLSASSDNGAYDEITVDTSSSKTVSVTTVSGACRAMVNSITFICDKADHTCDWDEGTVTKKATCTTDGEKTYSCTVEGCTKTKVETIPATGHSYDEDGACTICGVTPADVVAAAYALKSGESLEGTYTLTGVIKAVNTAYNSTFQNVTVTIDVIGVDGKPIQCYRMEGEGADQIGTGDTITVTGTLKNYNGTIEFDAGCTLDSWKDTGSDFVRPTTPEEIVNAAYALEVNASLEGGNYTLTGVISEVKNAYSAKYSDITVMMVVGDMTDKPIMCYQLKGDGVDEICVGDSITVTGTIKNYNGTVEFTPCTLDSYEIKNGHTIVVDAAVAPTYTATGLTAGEHCSVCNLVTVAQTEIPVLENPVETYNITLKDNIGINFVMKLAETDEVTVTVGGEAVDCAVVDGKLSINVAAAQMTDEIAIYVNGLPLAKTYSVRGYADEVLAGEYGANVKALVRAMLHYGAAAQDYFNYNDGDYANAGMTDTVTNPIQAAEMVPTTGETAGIVHYGSTLVYRDRVAVRVYFMLTGDAAIDTFTFTANGEAVEAQEGSNGLYYVEIADIAPQNLDDAVTVTVNDGLTVTYSALNYITRMVNKTEDNVLKNLLQQLYDYYMAAEYMVENGPDDFETEPDVVG